MKNTCVTSTTLVDLVDLVVKVKDTDSQPQMALLEPQEALTQVQAVQVVTAALLQLQAQQVLLELTEITQMEPVVLVAERLVEL
tara:strand:- start:17 stop:268 length:252 start_codon:yes stop_codon:yes gene_type:complete